MKASESLRSKIAGELSSHWVDFKMIRKQGDVKEPNWDLIHCWFSTVSSE